MLKRLRDAGLYLIAILIGSGLALSVVFGFGALVDEVQAQTTQVSSSGSDNACIEIGNVRGVYIARCVDPETGQELYANSVGWVEVVE